MITRLLHAARAVAAGDWPALLAGRPRSTRWRSLRAVFLAAYPRCAACDAARGLEVHHVVPYHLDPSLELSVGNLLTLCSRCHLFVGHLGSFRHFNPAAVEDASAWLGKVRSRPDSLAPARPDR